MLERVHGLTDSALEAIADLERRVLATDGGRLKLEWAALRNRPDDRVSDLLWWDGERLLGFVGIYGFEWEHLEVTGMVDPEARRHGIGRALFDAALPVCRERNKDRLLVVVPRNSPGGREFALGYGMTFEHSEHALTLSTPPEGTPLESVLDLRQATTEDIPTLSDLYLGAFGNGRVEPERLVNERSRTLMIDRGGQIVGTVAIAREGRRSAIYGFVVAAELRGRGIGREVLRRVSQDQFAGGAERVDLEVEVENDRALGLYTSTGFQPVATEDYYELRIASTEAA